MKEKEINPLEKFKYCPVCGSNRFVINDDKSKKCENCGFVYYLNPSSATAAFIINEKEELLVVTRKYDPAKGTFDLPGGFCDIGENAEESVKREIKEETNMDINSTKLLFTIPNKYLYSGFVVPTLDSFFLCTVNDTSILKTMDDAASTEWIPLDKIHTELFGLYSAKQAVTRFCKYWKTK